MEDNCNVKPLCNEGKTIYESIRRFSLGAFENQGIYALYIALCLGVKIVASIA